MLIFAHIIQIIWDKPLVEEIETINNRAHSASGLSFTGKAAFLPSEHNCKRHRLLALCPLYINTDHQILTKHLPHILVTKDDLILWSKPDFQACLWWGLSYRYQRDSRTHNRHHCFTLDHGGIFLKRHWLFACSVLCRTSELAHFVRHYSNNKGKLAFGKCSLPDSELIFHFISVVVLFFNKELDWLTPSKSVVDCPSSNVSNFNLISRWMIWERLIAFFKQLKFSKSETSFVSVPFAEEQPWSCMVQMQNYPSITHQSLPRQKVDESFWLTLFKFGRKLQDFFWTFFNTLSAVSK